MNKIRVKKAKLINLTNRNIRRSLVLIKILTRNRFNSTRYSDIIGIKLNRLLRKEFIPNPKEHIYIETTNICNLQCRFCAYRKSSKKKVIMSNEKFYEIINNATNSGYDTFGLTPIVGEVFVDKNFLEKLNFLENHKKVKNYHFFTNFTLANKKIIDYLIDLKKLKELFISIYGHDTESFQRFTGGNEKIYTELVENLKYLLEKLKTRHLNYELGFGLRTYRSFKSLDICNTELCQILRDILKKNKRSHLIINKTYYNWGGSVTQEDVKDLDIIINEPTKYYKNGVCSLILYKNQILADGGINACACRDAEATLKIGDLNNQSFEQIYSINNKDYINIIENQQKGNFSPICKSCDFYRSIYKNYDVYTKYKKEFYNLSEFYQCLSKK